MTYRISREDPLYAKLIEMVAEHPGSNVDMLLEHLEDDEYDIDRVQEELYRAVDNDDLTEADKKYWVMRYDGVPD